MQLLSRLLTLFGIRQDAAVIIWAARLDLLASAMVLIGAVVVLLPVTCQLLAALLRRRWPRARRHALYGLLLIVLVVYCLASVVDGLDTLDLVPP